MKLGHIDLENPQQVFNKIVKHLLKQNKQSITSASCRYFGDDGLKCAVGCLIPKKLYIPEIEGRAYSIAFDTIKIKVDNAITNRILAKTQYIHDIVEVKNWEQELKKLSVELNLKFKK